MNKEQIFISLKKIVPMVCDENPINIQKILNSNSEYQERIKMKKKRRKKK